MKYKWGFIFICLIICLFSIASVCAAGVNETVVTNDIQSDGINTIEGNEIDIRATEDLNENEGTFMDLYNLINNNSNSDIYLNCNYKYNSKTDSNFTEGITVKNINIYGNNFTIDGAKSAKIFKSVRSNLSDIIFKNGKAEIGGAASGGTYINCTFINNQAEIGGAASGGTYINCTFINNRAIKYGGAVNVGTSINCTFKNNIATTFNSAGGGAIYRGSADNCLFINNQVLNDEIWGGGGGGAAYSSIVKNSRLINNSAESDAGTLCRGSAINCTFMGNTADRASVMMYGELIDCTIYNNYETDEGMIFNSEIFNCTFENITVKKSDGLALYYKCLAVNCTFNNVYSPARESNLINCTFNNIKSTSRKCNFTECTFFEGGYIYESSFNNCSLINSRIFQSSARNCVFMNSTKTAMNGGNAINCLFINNSGGSNYYGGAMAGGSAKNCTYLNNHGKYGGATYNTDVEGCTFINNSAEKGGACYFDMPIKSVSYSKFNNNTASLGMDLVCLSQCDIIECLFSDKTKKSIYWNETIPNFINNTGLGNQTKIIMGNLMLFKDSDLFDVYLKDEVNFLFNKSVNLLIDGKSYIEYTDKNGKASFNLSDFNEKKYHIVLYFIGDSEFDFSKIEENITLKLNNKTNIICNEVCSYYPNCKIEATLLDYWERPLSNQYIEFEINGITYSKITNSKGQVSLELKLNSGEYIINILFKGNERYEFTKSKVNIKILSTININYSLFSDNLQVNADFYNSTGNLLDYQYVLFSLDGLDEILITNAQGFVKFNKQVSVGTHSLKIVNPITKEEIFKTFTIKKSTNIVTSNMNTVYNGGKFFVVKLKDNAGKVISGVKLTVVLNGKTYTLITDINGQARVSTNGLAPKIYNAEITFAGNTNYDKSTGSAKVTVTKATPKITAKAKTFKRTVKTKKYSITLKTNQNKVMKSTKVYIKVNKKTYTAKTNSRGVATFKITKLTKKGRYTAVVTYKGNAYYNKLTKKVKITVK